MSILGDAWVVIRAITKNLNKDIQDGLDDAAKDAEKAGNKAGTAYGSHFGDAAEDEVRKAAHKIGDALDDAFDPDRRGSNLGSSIGRAVVSGLAGALSGLASLTAMFALVTGLTGLIGGLIGAVGALAAGAVALTAALGPALAAIGVVGLASLGAFLGVIGAGIGIFKQLSDETATLGKNALSLKDSWKGVQAQFKEVFATVGEDRVFGPLNDLVKTLGDELFPILSKAIEGFGGAIGSTITRLNDLAESPLFQRSLSAALESMVGLADSFGASIVDLAAVFVHLIAAARPAIDMFSGWLRDWSEHLRTITEAGVETGKLGEFFRTAAAKAQQFFATLHNVWDVLRDVFKAASPLGGVFLDNFQTGTRALSDFTSSARGASTLFDFFKPGGQVHQNISAVWGLVKELGKSIATLTQAKGVEDLANGIRRLLPGVTEIVVSAVDAVGALAVALGDGLNSAAGLRGIKAVKTGLSDLGNAFAELGPAIGPLLQIIGDLASNLARALGPAFKAIADVLPDLVEPLDELGAALGDVLGDALKAVLPLLPPLVQIISSLAKALAGPLSIAIGAAATGLVTIANALAAVLNFLEPVLPMVIAVGAAFLAWRELSKIGIILQAMGGFMKFAGQAGGAMGTSIGVAGGALSKLGAILPVVGIAVAALSMAFEAEAQKIDNWANALGQGGEAAAKAQEDINNPDFWDKFMFNLTHWGNTEKVATAHSREASQALQEKRAAMDPLARSQLDLNQATNDYMYALDQFGPTAAITIQAHKDMASAQAGADTAAYNSSIANENYGEAVQQVADAIWNKIDAENAAASSEVATEQSALRMAEAYQRMIDVQNDPKADPIARKNAELDYAAALASTTGQLQSNAKAFAEAALKNGDFKSAGEAMSSSLLDQAGKYEALAQTVDGPYKDALLKAAQIARDQANQAFGIKIDASGAIVGLDQFTGYMQSLDTTFDTHVTVDGTDVASTQVGHITDSLLKFSQVVPSTEIDVVSDGADAAIQDVLKGLDDIDGKTPAAEVKAKVDEARANIKSILTDMLTVDGQTATPEVTAYIDQAMAGLDSVMGGMLVANNAEAVPQVLLDAAQFKGQWDSSMGDLNVLDGIEAVPGVDLNSDPFDAANKATNSNLTNLDGRTAVPDAALNSGPFNGTLAVVNGQIVAVNNKVAKPTATLVDNVSAIARAAKATVDALRDKTITIYTKNVVSGPSTGRTATASAAAGGGRINDDSWTTVGEEGRELVFLSQGQYVATYQKARAILAAASMQAAGIASGTGGTTTLAPVPVATGGGVTIPITVNPSAQMDELDLARKTGREFAFQFRKIT